jgi:putative ATP-dependent endonuclease of OLD family
MKLTQLKIEGYKRVRNSTCVFGDATFLIGPNNTGKSSVLSAIEYLVSANIKNSRGRVLQRK